MRTLANEHPAAGIEGQGAGISNQRFLGEKPRFEVGGDLGQLFEVGCLVHLPEQVASGHTEAQKAADYHCEIAFSPAAPEAVRMRAGGGECGGLSHG